MKKTAVITGASSGIGREFALQLRAEEIDEFWLIARNRERLEEVAKTLNTPCRILTLDLATDAGVEEYGRVLTEENPTVSYLVNAAGFGRFGSFDELDEESVVGMIDLNVKALVRITHMTVPYMCRGGHIVEMGSGSCFTPLPYFNIYASSKSFVLHYTKALFYEVKPYGLTATCFCPGWVDTAFLPKSLDVPGAHVPKEMKPLLDPERVVAGAIRAAKRGRKMYVTGWYTKLQHLLFKAIPDGCLSSAWLKMLKKNPPAKKPESEASVSAAKETGETKGANGDGKN